MRRIDPPRDPEASQWDFAGLRLTPEARQRLDARKHGGELEPDEPEPGHLEVGEKPRRLRIWAESRDVTTSSITNASTRG